MYFLNQGRYEDSKTLLKNIKNKEIGNFRPVIPPKSAVNGVEIVTMGKHSEEACQNCIKHCFSSKIEGDMNFQKNSEQNLYVKLKNLKAKC